MSEPIHYWRLPRSREYSQSDFDSNACGDDDTGNYSENINEVTCDPCRAVMASLSRADGTGAASSDAAIGGQEAKADPVSSPSHYRAGSVECIDAIDAALAGVKDPLSGFYIAQVIKYVWRHEQKGKPVEDLKKAKWYLDRLIKRLETR